MLHRRAVEIYFKESAWNEENYDDFKWDIRSLRRDVIGFFFVYKA